MKIMNAFFSNLSSFFISPHFYVSGKSAVTLPAVDLRTKNRGEGNCLSEFFSYMQYALEVLIYLLSRCLH